MLIGLTGKAGAGKDTVADYLVERGFAKVSFADPIKQMLCALMDVGKHQWEDRLWKERPVFMGHSPRYLAQTLGTEWGRKLVHNKIWIKLALEEADRYNKAIITDVRFDNEAQAIRDHGGVVIQVLRPGHEATEHTAHSSESGVDPDLIGRTIMNDRRLKDLALEIHRVMDSLGERELAFG